MIKSKYMILLLAVAAFVMTGCANPDQPSVPDLDFIAYSYSPDTYMPRIDRFIILVDVSASMGEMIGNRSKLGIVQDFLYRMNLTLPEYPDLEFAVRTFGHNPLRTIANTQLVSGFLPYRTADLSECILSLKHTGGQSPMALAINAAAIDLNDADCNTALILLSDGGVAGSDAVEATRNLKKKYSYRLSVYPVMIGHHPTGIRKMKEIAWMGQTGFFTNATEVEDSRRMGDFVRRVFLTPYPDTDGDTVFDIKDKCPDTPVGASIDDRGCWVLQNVTYAFDRWTIQPSYFPTLDEVIAVLNANPDLKVEIQGHTDNIGTDAYNTDLSLKRAESVKRYIVGQGIAHDRLYPAGYGFSRPVATNDTKEGRALNRRVELQPIRIQSVGF